MKRHEVFSIKYSFICFFDSQTNGKSMNFFMFCALTLRLELKGFFLKKSFYNLTCTSSSAKYPYIHTKMNEKLKKMSDKCLLSQLLILFLFSYSCKRDQYYCY